MKKLSKLGYIAIGMILALIIGTAAPAFAATKEAVKQLTAYFTSGGKPISVYVNGTKVDKDANGKAVTPFTVDGTTYLPVKAIADALGKSVIWDGATASVKINNIEVKVPGINKESYNAKFTYKIDEQGQLHDSLDYTFTLDKDAVGEWKTVDYCETISDFNPNHPSDNKQWYVGNSIYADGTMVQHRIAGNDEHPEDTTGLHWTEGYFVDYWASAKMDAIPAYAITTINDKTYMFLEWKSGDYIRKGVISYYVFVKTSDTPAPKTTK